MEPWDTTLRPSGDFTSMPVVTGASVSERYEVRGLLGRGGMARVYTAIERATGRTVALKRLDKNEAGKRRRRAAVLFEGEYRTLSQLAHPRVVEVYDYGVDAEGPYYTLELLDGGDLQEFAPVPWRTACAIARDVCSALSLLHSRRLVHRDVSPRNVRRTHDGTAKLIDFGAIAPMGPNKWLVGTPPCCPPESVQLQALDGRTDLFALGATLYFALTGRHAYLARHFSDVAAAWQSGFARPSLLVPEIPEALDALVADLLRLEPDARPANAAEVIERLCAIDGEPHVERLQVAQAYLVMPPLIGRAALQTRVQRTLREANRGRGALCVIEGESGVGRSRFLDACVLDAALLGAVCVRADAEDAAGGDYAVLRALARQLTTLLPDASRETSQDLGLEVLLPERAAEPGSAEVALQDTRALRPKLQAGWRAWLTALSHRRPLIVAVDDFDRIDEPSAAALSLLATDLPDALSMVLCVESQTTWVCAPAQKLVLERALRLTLEPLKGDESEQLLSSLFNAAPNVSSLAFRLHELASGKPRDLLRLAEHLVERGVVRYESGAWTLPARVDEADLPSSMAQALRARVEALAERARTLGGAFALCPDQGFDIDECALLLDLPDGQLLRGVLEQLMAADIVRLVGEYYRLPKLLWTAPLRALLSPERQAQLERRLSRVFVERGQDFRAGQHLLRAGDYAAALDVLVGHSRVSQEATAASSEAFLHYARSLPADWFATFERALALCDTLARPKRDKFVLLGRASGIMPAFGVPGHALFMELIEQLKAACGYREWERLDATLEPELRARTALSLAQAHYDSSSESERVLEPMAALRLLPRSLLSATSAVALGADVPFLRSFPDLNAFVAIVPGAGIIAKLIAGMEARYTGRLERAREIYLGLLQQTERDQAGALEASYLNIMRLGMMNGLAVTEACMGMTSSLVWTERTAAHPAYQMNSLQSRMLYHLYAGDLEQVDACKRQIEHLRLQSLQLYETSNLLWEIGAHVSCEDLTRLRRAIEALGAPAQHHVAWRAVQHYASAEYHRIRRDPLRALQAIEQALGLARPGEHPLWAAMASSHVRVLAALGRQSDALRSVQEYLASAQQAELGYMAEELWMALALCQAEARDSEAATTADGVLARLSGLEVRGIRLGMAHEVRARVALALSEQSVFHAQAELSAAVYGQKHPALLAKVQRLMQEAQRHRAGANSALTTTPDSYAAYTAMRMLEALEHCKGNEARARLALTILCRQMSAVVGYMLLLIDGQLECVAAVGGETPPPGLVERAREYLDNHAQGAMTTSTGDAVSEDDDTLRLITELAEFRPVLLSHEHAGALALTGVVLLRSGAGIAYPGQLIGAISRYWAQTGHVSTFIVDDTEDDTRLD